MKEIITYSLIQTFKDCRRKAKYRYIDELSPRVTPKALALGQLVHLGLQEYYKQGYYTPVPAANSLDSYDTAMAREMILGYIKLYSSNGYEIIHIEKPFEGEIPKSNRALFSGKIDLIVRKEDGGYWIEEHKTTSYLGAAYLERLWLDSQIIGYAYAGRNYLGLEIKGVIYDIIRKGIRPKKTETQEAWSERCKAFYSSPEAYFRQEILFTESDYKNFEEELYQASESYIEAKEKNHFYKNTSQCFHWGRPCPYLPICKSWESPIVIETDYVKTKAHSELEESENGE